eukprot:TRINITY_DN2232_c0_g1_i1.p1 TRINITY_DN2232_c0_g1~~TRINITY_DN2232_c0_g1_i1.p1  ORF type:complete len:599 (-),score=95.50 TRINITY_DN2232_c0_g1_i1:200-1996(-)
MSEKVLCVDVLNFSAEFMGGSISKHHPQWPKLNKIEDRVSRFVNASTKLGFKVVAFLDESNITPETINKWRTRREREVRGNERNIIQAFGSFVGEYFKRNNVEVHYSLEADNDDTLVSFAFSKQACILSEDKDMFRYTHNGKPLNLTVYSDFHYDAKGDIVFEPHPYQHAPLPVDRSLREVIVPPPKTNAVNLDFRILLIKEKPFVSRGSPSPLTRNLGNIHHTLTPLRQAGYYKANLSIPIQEMFPDWDIENNRVKWIEQTVLPDSKYLDLLENPIKALEAFPDPRKLTERVPYQLIKHHEMARKIVACEIISSATLIPILNLLENFFPELFYTEEEKERYAKKKEKPFYAPASHQRQPRPNSERQHRDQRPIPPQQPIDRTDQRSDQNRFERPPYDYQQRSYQPPSFHEHPSGRPNYPPRSSDYAQRAFPPTSYQSSVAPTYPSRFSGYTQQPEYHRPPTAPQSAPRGYRQEGYTPFSYPVQQERYQLPPSYAPPSYRAPSHHTGGVPHGAPTQQYSNDTLFVTGLPEGADENSLVELFKDFGVSNVKLPVHRETGQRRGFAFVKFTNEGDCNTVLEKDAPFHIGEKQVSVKRSKK